MNEKSTVVPSSVKTWKKPKISADWWKCFSRIYAFSKDNRLRQFSFKLLHRIITTRKELKRYNSIEHNFINCHNSVHFYNLALRWFNSMHNIEIDLSGDQFDRYMFRENGSLSNLTLLQKRRLDILLVYQKQYIYNCKVFGKNLNLDEFTNKIFLQWKLKL